MSHLGIFTGISSIGDVIRYNHLCWFGPIQHIDEEKWPRKILNFEVNCSYHQGCPKKRWFDNIRSDLDRLQLPTSLALDCVKWRNTIKPSRHVVEFNPCCWGKKGC